MTPTEKATPIVPHRTFVNVYCDDNGRFLGDEDYQSYEAAYNSRDKLSTYIETIEIVRKHGVKDKKYYTAFDNLNKLNDMVLDKAQSILKDLNNETEFSILKTIQGNKPEHLSHLSDEEWEKHKKLGQRLLKLNTGSHDT